MRRLFRWLIGRSIRRQLIAGVAAVHLVLMTIFVFDLTQRQKFFLFEKANSEAEFQITTLVSSSKEYLRTRDLVGLQEVLDAFAHYQSISYAMIIAPDGKILSHSEPDKLGLFLQDSVSLAFLSGPREIAKLDSSERRIEIIAPIMENTAFLGWARIATDLSANQVHVEYVGRHGVLYTVLAILIGTLFAIALSRIILQQLHLLMKGAKRLGSHQLDEPIPIIADNEIGTLSVSFNEAMQALDHQNMELRNSEEKYRLLSETAKDIIIVYNMRGEITYLNAVGLESTGLSEQNYRGRNLFDFIPEKYHTGLKKNIQERTEGFVGNRLTQIELINIRGELIPIEVSSSPIMQNGKIESLLSVARNITDRKRAEEKLQKLNRLYAVISQINEMIVRAKDEEEVFKRACTIIVMYGKFQMAWIGLVNRTTGNVAPVQWAGVEEGYLTFAEKFSTNVDEKWGKGPTGTCIREKRFVCCNDIATDPNMEPWRELALSRNYRSSIALPIILSGEPIGAFVIFATVENYFTDEEVSLLTEVTGDISFAIRTFEMNRNRKAAESALRESEEKFRSLYENNLNGVFLTTPDGTIISANPSACDILGRTEEEICRVGRPGVVDMSDPRLAMALQERTATGRFNGELIFVRKDGVKFPCDVSSVIFSTKDGHFLTSTIFRDITEKKRVEQEREQYFKFFKTSTDIMVIADPNGCFLKVNPSCIRLLGYSEEELFLKPFVSLLHPDDRQKTIDEMNRQMQQGYTLDFENRYLCKDGSYLWLSWIANYDKQAGVTYATARDITDRKRTEEKLHIFSRAIEQSTVSIVITDTEGIIEYVNPKFLQNTEYTFEEIVGKKPNILKTGHTSQKEYERMWKTISAGGEWWGEFLNKKKSGKVFWENASISPIKNEQGVITHFLGVKEDVSEKKKLQEQVEQVQKIESLGTLASGIAHDFNNVLGIILAYTGFLERSQSNPTKMDESLKSIRTAVERGANLVKQILTFARKTETTICPMDVGELIDEIVSMLRETFPKTIELRTNIEERLPYINADRTKIHQAVMNLCVNARDAMANEGLLTIAARRMQKSELPEKVRALFNHPCVILSVTDTGSGMDENTMLRIFDPFFTTKELGKGTGLGLSVVYGVVEAHKGYIDVESELGFGTKFTLYLPLADEEELRLVVEDSPVQKTVVGGSEKILVVEDEEMLISMLRILLEAEGYTVIEAHDGEEAVNIFHEKKDEIDVVLTDMGLPKLSGHDVFVALQNLKPDVKVIFASGFFEPNIKVDLMKRGAHAFIQKPYDRAEMLRVLRELLD
ncbi:MAG: PAS domain S-box protein [Bacteroidota bacterium]